MYIRHAYNVFMYAYTYIHYVCMLYVCMYVFMFVCMYVFMYVYQNIHILMCVHICVSVCECGLGSEYLRVDYCDGWQIY